MTPVKDRHRPWGAFAPKHVCGSRLTYACLGFPSARGHSMRYPAVPCSSAKGLVQPLTKHRRRWALRPEAMKPRHSVYGRVDRNGCCAFAPLSAVAIRLWRDSSAGGRCALRQGSLRSRGRRDSGQAGQTVACTTDDSVRVRLPFVTPKDTRPTIRRTQPTTGPRARPCSTEA